MRALAIALALALATSVVRAEPTQLVLNHQGRLLDANDAPVSGTLAVTVLLYKSPEGGGSDLAWSETYTVPVSNGIYTIAVGDTLKDTKKALRPADVNGDRWLAVQLAGTELLPRQRIGTVPRAAWANEAVHAANADQLGGVDAAKYALKTDLSTDAATLQNHPASDFLGAGATAADAAKLGGQPASAYQLATATAVDSAKLQGHPASDFLGAGATAADSAKLGGQAASAYLLATATATDSAKLGGQPASAYVTQATNGAVGLTGPLSVPQNGLKVGTNQLVAANNAIGVNTALPQVSLDVGGATDGVRLPVGSTAQRPTGQNGLVRFNSEFGVYEFFSNGFWFRTEPVLAADATKNRVVFNYTGGDQSFTVPNGVTSIFVKTWGAGGAGGTPGGWNYGAAGGAGGHARGVIPVIPGEALRIMVGQHGYVNQGVGFTYGGGASGCIVNNDNRYGGGGGGLSGIFRGSTPLLIAGGGGGGGSSRLWTGNVGGAGGGLVGQHGESPYDGRYAYGGRGGTQTAGGVGGTGSQNGAPFQGGHAGVNCYGGGGGGGYYGGGGGGYAEANTMAGGGGGSSFVGPTVLFGAALAGSFQIPPMVSDPDFQQTGADDTLHAHGGGPSSQGGNGFVVVYY